MIQDKRDQDYVSDMIVYCLCFKRLIVIKIFYADFQPHIYKSAMGI